MIEEKSLDLKLLHGFLREVLRRSPIHAVIHCHTVNRNLGQQVLMSRYVNPRIVVGVATWIRNRHDADAALKTCEFKKVAPIQWQVLNLNLTHSAFHGAFASVDAGCLVSYQDLFFDRTRPQLKIDCQVVPYTQREMLHFRTETGGESLDLIVARLETSYVVRAVSINPQDPAISKLQLADSEVGFRHDSASNIVNYSVDGSLGNLSEERTPDQKV